MSYDIIKSIKIDTKNKKVFITSACNNVTPKKYTRWHATALDKYFADGGVEAIKKDILFAFFRGSFQGESTNYGKCMQSFIDKYNGDEEIKFQDYLKCSNGDIEFKKAFLNKLYQHYLEYECNTKSKDLFIIKVGTSYILKLRRNGASTTGYETAAQTFNLARAEDIQKRFSHAKAEIIKVKN